MTIPSSCLWLTGLPGTGKTILCAAAIQRIRKEAQYACVLYFFCDHGDPSKRTHESFIVSLVRQMFETTPELLQQAEILYNEKSNNGERPFNRAEYVPLLCTFLGHFDRIYLFCDALDEASDGSEIAQTLEEMLQYAIAQNVDLHLLFTSRFDIQFEQRHSRITENSIKLAGNMRADIAQYVHKELEARLEKGTLKVRGKELGITIQNQISSRAGT